MNYIKHCTIKDRKFWNQKFFVLDSFTEKSVYAKIYNYKNCLVEIMNRSDSVVILEKNAKIGFFQTNPKHLDLNFLLSEKQLEPYEKITRASIRMSDIM